IAEPWDLGESGYQVGNFPPLWSEWNGRYRDHIRDFWRGEGGTLSEFGYRLTGSSDLYQDDGRRPSASVNFVTAHDGFTLADLVSYDSKHNEANGEDNRDGESHNRSWNHGVEGATEDPAILALRLAQTRNFLATLLLSQGIPMLLGGDEMGRSQGGNNNAYCQDNEISWYDWSAAEEASDLIAFVAELTSLRRAHPVFRRRRWFLGRPIRGEGVADISWFTPDGREMTEADWQTGYARSIAVFLNGEAIPYPDARGERVVDDSFLLLMNAHHEDLAFVLPEQRFGESWTVILNTATRGAGDPTRQGIEEPETCKAGSELTVNARSLVVLRRDT
ncbi:MAG: glycogen debranching enzyme, partial [Acidimicrobiia bacterium]